MKKNMEIIYVSSTMSEQTLNNFFEKTGKNFGFASLKFNRLVVAGLSKVVSKCTALSNLPLTPINWPKKLVNVGDEHYNGIHYHYMPFINIWYLKHICVLLYSFLYVLWRGIISRRKCIIVCDVLSKSGSIGALCASKILGLKSLGIVTDLPWLVVPEGVNPRVKPKHSFLYWFTHYVFLTDPMNAEINKSDKPYIVMEGLCDQCICEQSYEKNSKRTILYAGTLMEKYGIKTLVEAFIRASLPNTQLVIYGDGPYAIQLKELENKFDIHYKGLASSEIVVEEEKKATLLVNPRPTHEEYTKFSFPSKNMEYMATGTPLLTTRLPGIPKEYEPYVFFFDGETIDSFSCKFREIFSLPLEQLQAKGQIAQKFVLENKNNIVQAERIIGLLNK